jgi:hypothetical protein
MKKILFATMAGAAAVITIAPANAADLGLRPMDAAPRLSHGPRATSEATSVGGWGRETVSIPNLGQTTGVPELAGVSLPSVTGNTKALSVAVRSGATINLHPTG